MDEVAEALEKYRGLVPLVYDIETMGLAEARPQDMYYAVYLKREADKVIARHKYKRFVAMARWSKAGMYLSYECDFKREWWNKWRKRWLELADQFNPNSTATKENSDG